jgi:hypothetical protein
MSAEKVQASCARAIQTGEVDVLYLFARAIEWRRGSDDAGWELTRSSERVAAGVGQIHGKRSPVKLAHHGEVPVQATLWVFLLMRQRWTAAGLFAPV